MADDHNSAVSGSCLSLKVVILKCSDFSSETISLEMSFEALTQFEVCTIKTFYILKCLGIEIFSLCY